MNNREVLKKAKWWISLTFISSLLLSISLSFIPLTSGFEEGKSNIMAYIIAAIFWVSLILVLISVCLTRKKLNRVRGKMIIKGCIKKHHPVGVVSFSGNLKMLVLYGITVIGLILVVTDIIWSYVPEALMFPIISVTILSFMVHCIVDGKYYKAYKQIKENLNNETNR